jgi:3-methyladenine DNA glycosylase AlkC
VAELLKNNYNAAFFERLTRSIEIAVPSFKKKDFLKSIFSKDWEQKELKERMKHISLALKTHLKQPSYSKEISALKKIISQLRLNNAHEQGFEYLFFPDFIEQYGIDDFDTSIKAIEFVTQFVSCEFAIRPFIVKYPEKSMAQMYVWSTHKHPSVRRLSSEGSRPRLPWAMALPQFKKDPGPIISILENLKADSSEYVRRSVANNLNDISKDNPNTVVDLATKWNGTNDYTNWIIKHGSRSLLKQARPEILNLFGLSSKTKCEIENFKIKNKTIHIGEYLVFSFELITHEQHPSKLRIEYAVYYMKSNGKQNRKLFKITENTFEPNKTHSIQKKQSFQDFTTRKHYRGAHAVAIVINGVEFESLSFQLK